LVTLLEQPVIHPSRRPAASVPERGDLGNFDNHGGGIARGQLTGGKHGHAALANVGHSHLQFVSTAKYDRSRHLHGMTEIAPRSRIMKLTAALKQCMALRDEIGFCRTKFAGSETPVALWCFRLGWLKEEFLLAGPLRKLSKTTKPPLRWSQSTMAASHFSEPRISCPERVPAADFDVKGQFFHGRGENPNDLRRRSNSNGIEF
jgi:hypothetical protein